MALLGSFLFGCQKPCVGVGCAEEYDAALVGVIDGTELNLNGYTSPLDTYIDVEGIPELGPNWDVAISEGLLVVGSPLEGAIRLFDGTTSTSALGAEDASVVIASEDPWDSFGASIDMVPDIDGDGTSDFIVGAPDTDLSTTSRAEGAAHLISGAVSGEEGEMDLEDQLLFTVKGRDLGGQLGQTVVGCPDMDGDGLGEFAVGAPRDNSFAILGGSVTLVYSADITKTGDSDFADAFPTHWGLDTLGGASGFSLCCQDDLTGDGVPDLLVGAPFADGNNEAAGSIFILDGTNSDPTGDLADDATIVLTGLFSHSWTGWSVQTGDINGDGYAEVVAGAPAAISSAGLTLVWDGADVMAAAGVGTAETPQPRFRINGDAELDSAGHTIAVEDLDGDGQADLIIGAPKADIAESASNAYDSGALYIFRGAKNFAGWRPNMSTDEAEAIVTESQEYLRTGQIVKTGDINGDGTPDLALVHRHRP